MNALVSVSCADRVGLVAAITGRLFDLGGNLGDTTFAVLGGSADFTSVVDLPDGLDLKEVENALRAAPEIGGGSVSVVDFTHSPTHGPTARITHRVTVSGGDRPGLIARISELLIPFDANIVRLDAERIPGSNPVGYAVFLALHVPAENAETCLATLANTAGSLSLSCHWEAA